MTTPSEVTAAGDDRPMGTVAVTQSRWTARVTPMMEGIVVLGWDDPTIRKGSVVQLQDGRGVFTAEVTRRRRQRDGSLKLWCGEVTWSRY
jgi:hypothetical protein